MFLSIFILGLALRLLSLNAHDFWFDEAFTYHIAKLPINQLISAVLTDNNPPIYYIIIHYLIKINESQIILRLPSLISNLIAAWALYWLAKRLLGPKTAIIAFSLFTLSPLTLYLSAEARPHALGTAFLALTIAAFFYLIEKVNFKSKFFFILAFSLALLTHFYTAILTVPLTWIIFTSNTRLKPQKWLLILSIPLSFLALWIIFSLQAKHNFCACPNTLLSLPASLVSPALGGVGSVTLRTFPQLPFFYLLLFTATAAATFIFFLHGLKKSRNVSIIYLFCLILISILGLEYRIFSPKAFAIFSPLYLLIVANSLNLLKLKIKLAPVLIFLFGLISIIQIANPFFAGDRLRPISQIVSTHPNTPIVHVSVLTFYSTNYYTGGNRKNILLTDNPLADSTLAYIGGQKESIGANYSSLWLVDSQKWVDPKERQETINNLAQNYNFLQTYNVSSFVVTYLERK